VPQARVWLALAVLLLLLLPAPPARATQCRAIDGGVPELAAIDAETRLRWIDHRLSVDAKRARIWAITWGMAYGSLTIGQLAFLSFAHETQDRANYVVGASASFIGVLAGVFLPLKIMGDQTWWERHYARSRGDDPCALLNTAERLLIRDAESEAFGVGPLVHIGNFAINIAAGLVLGLGYDKWDAFATVTLVGIVVGEVQASTQPTDAVEDLRLYRAAHLDERPQPPRLGLALAPMLLRDGAGMTLSLRW
jgi:hypothetical protein